MKNKQTLENYYKDISDIQLITPDEEIELTRRIKNNDQEALDKLVRSNLRFVVSVAKGYQNHGLSLEDLINEGNLGLLKAAQRFDETRGFKFISYAVWWIRQAILQAIAEKTRMIRLPLNRISILTKVSKVYGKLEQEYKRTPTNDEIADILEIGAENISNTIKKAARVNSLDSKLNATSNTRLLDVLTDQDEFEPDSNLMEQSLKDEIRHILNGLSKREAKILILYYGLDGSRARTLEEIGMEFKLTRERIRQIKEKVLIKLRNGAHRKVLQQYL
ncbi:MAG: RNA polymerase sigma factor RpoD/SigA [Calditrichaceae bacterium]